MTGLIARRSKSSLFFVLLSEPFGVNDWSHLTKGAAPSHLRFTSTLLGTRCFCTVAYCIKKEKKWRNNSIMLFRVLGRCFVHFVKDSAVASSPSVIFSDQSNGWSHVRSSTFLVMFYITNYVKYCLYIYDVIEISMLFCGICTKDFILFWFLFL